jgi:hypothetical protein
VKNIKPPFVVVDLPMNVHRPNRLDELAQEQGGKLADTDEGKYFKRYHYTFRSVAKAKKFQAATDTLRLPYRAIILVQ